MLRLVIEGSVKIGAFCQVLLSVTLRVALGRPGHAVGIGCNGNAGRNGGSGDNREQVEVHGVFLEMSRDDLARQGMGQTYARAGCA